MSFVRTCKTLMKVADDEPIFTLRAQDMFAPAAVRLWIQLVGAGLPVTKRDEAEMCAKDMEEWQAKNGCKVPD